MTKLALVYLTLVSALFLTTLTFIPEAQSYRFQSTALAQSIPTPKWRSRYIDLIKKASLLKEKESVDRLIYQTLALARDLPSFRTHHFFEAKWNALHQLISTLYFYEQHALKIKEVNQSETKPCYQLTKGAKQWGFLKKRANLYYEQACWDLSLLLEMDALIAPSFPIEIEGTPYVFQPFLQMRTYRTLFTSPQNPPKRNAKISQCEYWKANLLMTLIAPEDLHAGNIGYTKHYSLLFFDNEHVFSSSNTFSKNAIKLTPPCMNHLFDWPARKHPLTEKNASYIRDLLQKWKKQKAQLHAYLDHPSIPNFLTPTQRQTLFQRFDTLIDLNIQKEATTFLDVIEKLYPNLYDGLEELIPIIEQITKRSVSPMSSLQFLTSHRLWWEGLEKSDEQKMGLWVEKYHSDREK